MNKLTQSNSQLLPSLLSVALTLIGTSSFAQNVGVDIASPQQKLDVAGGLRIGNTTNGLAGSIRWTGTQFEGHDGTAWIPLGSAADNDWIISGVNQYSGVAGNVGIGTTTPSDKLDVLGTIRATNPGTSPNGSDIRLGSPANDIGVTMNRGNGSGSSQQRWDIKITSDNALRFRSQNTTDYFAFTNTGNMGIGTNSPADKLHVVGSIRMVDGNQAAGRVLVSDANGTMIWTNLATSSTTYLDEIRDADNDTKIQVEESADEDIIRFDAQGSQLYAMRKMAGGTPWIEVNSSNTLIGSSISTAINGSGVYNTAMGYQSAQSLTTGQKNTYFGDNAGGFNTTGNWNTMIGTVAGQFNNGGNANTMVGANAGRNNLTGSGNVFLGNGAGENETTSNKLYIDNSSTATPLIYGDFSSNLLRVNGTLNVNNAYDMPTVAGTNGFVLQTNGAGAATWVNPNTIGADVTTASNGLTETGNDIQLGGPLTANTTITQDNAEVLTLANNGSGSTVINLQSTGDFDVQDNGTTAFLVKDDGNVGIGTNAPSEKLDVWGNLDLSAVQPVLKFSATGTPRTTNLTATFSPTSTAAQTLRVNLSDNTNTGTTEVMRFQGDGNVGIGVTSPTARLDIIGIGEDATSTALRLRSGNAGLGILSNQIVFGHNGLPNQQHAIKTRHHSALHERNAIDFYVWQPGDAANVGTKRVMTIDGKDNGMVGIGVLQPLDELHVVGNIRMVDGNQSAGRVIVSDANGTGTWTAPTSLSITEDQALTMTNHTLSISEGNSVTVVAKLLTDADSDTKVQVEESADEDVIRFDMAGIEHFVMNEGRLAVLNTGASIFIGQNAGINDDWSNNNNIGIGQNALEDNIIGGGNTAIGTNTLSNSNTSDNVAIGENTLTALTTGQGNTAVGKGGFQTNSTGSFNTSLGLYAGYFNQGSSNVFLGHRAGQDEAGSNKLYIDNTNTASPLIYGDFGTNELTVNGELGIGTTAPTEELHVVGNIRMVDGNQAAGKVLVSDANGTGTWTDPTSLTITETDPQVSSATTNYIPKWNGTTLVDGIAFDNGTNIGIGTTSPTAKLDIVGTLNGTGGATFGNNVVVTGDYYLTNTNGTGTNNPNFRIDGFSDKLYVIAESSGTGPVNGTEIRLRTANANSAASDRVTINNNGNVGIGTTTPGQRLDVNGDARIQNGTLNVWALNASEGGQINLSDGNIDADGPTNAWSLDVLLNDFRIMDDGAVRVFIQDDGNLGIGTLTPGSKLHVAGSIRMVDGNQAAGRVLVSDANGTGTWTPSTSLSITETDPQVSSSTANYVPKWNGTTLTDGAIYDNGNVGIGTTAPSHPLHVRNTNGYVQRLESSAATGTRLAMENTSTGGLPWQIISTGSANVEGAGNFLFMDGSTVRMALMSANGNVGIGTVTPGSKLHVVGNIRMVDGAEAAGRVLVSDANGTGTWTAPTSLSITEDQALTMSNHTLSISEGNSVTVVAKSLTDADNDTKVQVEESADEDIIRFDMAGTEHFTMTRGRLSVLNTGASVFIGQDAGVNDDWTNNNNIGIGINALNDNVTGGGNTAIGSNTLSNSSTSDNVAIGENTLTALTTGQGNTAVGKGGFQTNSTGSFNTSLGLYAGYNNQGSSNVFLGHRAGQDEAGSDKLYIDNTNTATPLIYGDFSTDELRINGTLNVNNAYNLPTVAGTNGFVLQTDGAGVASWVNASTLTVTETDPQVSSATTNQIPKWNGTTLTDGIITDNGTNVGIGITAPGAKLDVAGNLRGTDVTAIGTNGNIMMANSNTSGTTPFRIDGNADKLYVIAENGTDGSATGTEIRFRTATSNSAAGDRMTINNQGNVGIGTAAPSDIMHVVRNTSDAIVKIESPGSFYDARLVFQKNGANTATVGFFPGTAELRLRTGQADGILFEPNGVERMRVNFDGNVGIATILPQEKLHVVGKIRMVDGNQATGKVLVSDANGSATWTAATSLTVTETDPQVSSATTNYVPKWNGTTLTDGAIFDNGSIGIGTNSPASSLEVQGASGSNAVITIDQQGADQYTGVNIQRDATEQWFVGMNNTDDDFIIRGDAATDFVTIKNSDGNVGLGIALPVYDLDIHKTEVAVNQRIYSNDGAGIGQMLVGANGGGHVNLVANSSAATYLGIPVGVSGVVTDHSDMVLATGTGGTATEKVRITTAGNLGIGSTAPGARLEVITDGTAGTGTLISQFGSTAAAGRIRFYDESATVGPSINFNAGNVAQITGAGNIALSPTGNVGVGTTTPTQAKLVVNGSQNTTLSYGYLNSGGNTGTSTNQTVPFSIYASARIAATEFNAYSDQRIKSINGITDGATDLNTLMGIEVTDYTFIDKVEKGNGVQKKVIAQQVEQVYPQAVATITDVVPDIYKLAEIRDGRIAIANTLKAGEKVRLVLADRTELAEVMAADADGFSVSLKDNGQVFVFGREVSDFRTVDYEALSMLNLSATQELVRMINGLKRENEAMKADFSSLSSDVEMLKAMLNAGSTAGK